MRETAALKESVERVLSMVVKITREGNLSKTLRVMVRTYSVRWFLGATMRRLKREARILLVPSKASQSLTRAAGISETCIKSVSIFYRQLRSIDLQLLDPSYRRGNSGSLSGYSWPSCREGE